jgi:hypothetical protein
VLYTRWSAAGKGVMEKRVDQTTIKRGVDSSAAEALQARIDELWRKSAWEEAPQSKVFRVV